MDEKLKGQIEGKLEGAMGAKFKTIVVLTIIGAIVSLIIGVICFSLFSNVWGFVVILVIVTALLGMMSVDIKGAAILGGLTGLIVGALQNHILSLVFGGASVFYDVFLGNPFLTYLIIGIIVGILARVFLGNHELAVESRKIWFK